MCRMAGLTCRCRLGRAPAAEQRPAGCSSTVSPGLPQRPPDGATGQPDTPTRRIWNLSREKLDMDLISEMYRASISSARTVISTGRLNRTRPRRGAAAAAGGAGGAASFN